MAGSLFFGAVSDFFGRRFCLFFCSALAVGLSITVLESIYTDIYDYVLSATIYSRARELVT